MENKYTWDLESLLHGKSLEHLHQCWLNKQNQLLTLYPKFDTTFQNFKKWIDLEEEYEIISNRLINYISNNYNEELANPKWISWSQKLQNESNVFSVKTSDISNRIIKNEKNIRKFLKQNSIKEHSRSFEMVFRNKPHVLSDAETKLLSTTSIVNGGFGNIFSSLSDNDIKFEDATDSKGKKVPLKTVADVMINIKSKNRELRKTTWINFNKSYANFENTLTQTLYYNYLMLNTNSKIHKFKDYISATAFEDEINEKLIINLYKQVSLFKPSIQRYRRLTDVILKKQLRLSKLEPWDKTVDLIKKDIKFTIEETQDIVLKALSPLGSEYINNIKKAFNEHWISWLPKLGKQHGAYSIGGTKGLNKFYISMNFDKSIRSIATIAHELGHSMNSLYINKKQKIYTDTSIFYAEISSIVNEVLLSYYFLQKYKNDKDMKRMILDELIGNFFATTIRQIIFSNFEYVANQYVNESKPFTKEELKKIYIEMIQKYQGIDKETLNSYNKEPYSFAPSLILRVPHFYAGNFYVYKYAIGQIVATTIANKIYHGDKATIDSYFKFLSSGDSLSPIETIKLLGINLHDSKVYTESKQTVDRWINDLAKLK